MFIENGVRPFFSPVRAALIIFCEKSCGGVETPTPNPVKIEEA